MYEMKIFFFYVVAQTLYSSSKCIYLTNDTKIEQNPAVWTEQGTWGSLLEEWALNGNHREKRVMQLPPTKDAYVMDELHEDDRKSKLSGSKVISSGPQKPPGRQVSETDLYLLGAIEKLVYRVDFMEKRLRRVEEMLYFVMAGNRVDHEPCPNNFTRVGSNCYFFYNSAGREFDWKAASKQCKKIGSALAEMETIEENQDVIAYIQSNTYLRGRDFWTGGLNPGLLWIWSNTARPVQNNNKKNPTPHIMGEGRCLSLAYDPALRSYFYRGNDCGNRYSYICEIPETTSANEIRRIGRERKIIDEL